MPNKGVFGKRATGTTLASNRSTAPAILGQPCREFASMSPQDIDFRVRSSVFSWLNSQKLAHGEILPWQLLSSGFHFEGVRVPLIGANGIFKPAILPDMPISITTSPNTPYDDELRDGGGEIGYRFRGKNPDHRDNVGLVRAMKTQTPLVYFLGTRKGSYLATYPVYVTDADPANLVFRVQIDDDMALARFLATGNTPTISIDPDVRRQYVTSLTKRRLHQAVFRDRVITAYNTRCALCRLRHASLLDAAHIIPDNEPEGAPVVTNGLALCKIHHAAFDQNFLGITPTYKVEIKTTLLDEIDGPMLQYGIKAMHGQSILLPRSKESRPDKQLLEKRFQRFLESAK